MNLTKIGRILSLSIILGSLSLAANAEQKTIDKVTIEYEVQANGTAILKYAINKSSSKVQIKIDGNEVATLNPGNVNPQSAQINKTAYKYIRFDYPKTSGGRFWKFEAPAVTSPAEEVPHEAVQEVVESSAANITEQRKMNTNPTTQKNNGGSSLVAVDRINQDDFFGTDAVAYYVQKADSFTKALSQSENKAQFILDNDIKKFLSDSELELQAKKNEITSIAQEAVAASNISDTGSQTRTLNLLIETLNGRYNQRQSAYEKLQSVVDSIPEKSEAEHSLKETIINYSIIGVIVLVLAIWMIIAIRKKKKKSVKNQQSVQVQSHQDSDPNNPAIVVRRRTTSILKKQNIDDVINNPEYMLINSSEFTPDSAVRNIYIKNTCIKEVYNLYAEDLRNSNNPKEDGCMVLGRWVHNEDSNTYDISLETVVFPGDDAVFKEYELNFGGKIKLRIAEKLRKLRRETNLQYDLVCWIHSHPGLGVFFSNSDDNVQMQLKHSQHPYFLIAFVVDILTSDQEMGIFTFRKDGTMNTKGDLTKMYSLEDMYKWALESDKASFNPDNYHNILASAKMQMPTCKGIELNNSSIIDLTQIVIEPSTGIVGWAVGTTVEVNGGKEFVVSSIVKADEKPSAGIIGVLLNVTHMSLPTIQRLIANENINPSFVMVYSSKQNTLTSIPVINGELITDEHFYGEETIDDLKIWTRRKR